MNQEIDTSVKHGKILIIISVAMIPVFLILSDGYDPRLGPLTSFYYSMTVFDAQWFCHQVPIEYALSGVTTTKCWNIAIYTKYLVLLCVLLTTYGVLISKKMVFDPFVYFIEKFHKLKINKDMTKSKEE